MPSRRRIDGILQFAQALLLATAICGAALATGAVRPIDWIAVECAALLLCLLWIARFIAGYPAGIRFPPATIPAVALIAYVVANVNQATVLYVAEDTASRYGVYALVFLLGCVGFTRKEHSQRVCFILISLGFAVAAYGIFQYATGSQHVWTFIRPEQYAGRASGTFICPNHFGSFLGLLWPVAASLAVFARVGPVTRIALGYSSGVMLLGVALSLSRGAWLGSGLAMLILIAAVFRRAKYPVLILAVISLLLAALASIYSKSTYMQMRLAKATTGGTTHDIGIRYWLADSALQMWNETPIRGIGPGQFDVRFPQYRDSRVIGRPLYAHNEPVNFLAEYGVAGTILLLPVVLFTLLPARRFLISDDTTDSTENLGGSRRALVFGCLSALFGFSVHSLFDFNLQVPGVAMVAMLWAGFCAGPSHHRRKSLSDRPAPAKRFAAVTLLLVATTLMAYHTSSRIPELLSLERAQQYAHQRKRLLQNPGEALSDETSNDQNQVPSPDELLSDQLKALIHAATLNDGNPDTPYAIGEVYRRVSWTGGEDYEEFAQRAISWHEKSAALNPYDPTPHLRIGMCLDWIGRHTEAGVHFEQAVRLDPNNYYVHALHGWHYVQCKQYYKARAALNRSLIFKWWDNRIARNYLGIIENTLKEPNITTDP